MKHLLLYYLASAISTGQANAGPVDCQRIVAQKPLSTVGLESDSTATSTAAIMDAAALSSAIASSTTSTATTVSSTDSVEPTSPSTPFPLPNYLPVFYDDFSGIPGSLPSSSNWIFDTGTSYPGGNPNWGNEEKEIYTTSTSNIQITSSSTLLITPIFTSNNWTSARIETQRADFQCPDNRKLFIQARIKLGDDPVALQQGIWPAFWALGSSFRGSYDNWPQVTEWDIMESINGLETTIMTIHCGTAPDGPCDEYNGISSSTSMSRGVWNTIGFEVDRTPGSWESETLTWYLNGETVFVVEGSTVGDEDAWTMLAHEPHFLLLDVAVVGSAADIGSFGGNTPVESEATTGGVGSGMEVDYVGVWVSPL